jgi:hypothetical protein
MGGNISMTLEEFLALSGSKYAVISSEAFDADPVAQTLSDSPRRFKINTGEYVVLSLNPESVQGLVSYVISTGVGVEYEFLLGTGSVSLLTHTQTIGLLSTADFEDTGE